MKKIFVIFLITSLFVFCSCQNMLDIYPHSAVAPASITEKDLPALEMGMYLSVQNNPTTESWILNDILGGTLTTSTSNFKDLINNTLNPLNSIVAKSFNGYFKALYQVNNVMSIVDNLNESVNRNRIKGTAHYFRALLYYNLVTRWGDMPILRHNTLEKPVRQPVEQVWNFIKEDLDEAMLYLGSSKDYYYVSLDAVTALKARVLLTLGENEEAAQLAESLITSGKYNLDSFDKIFRRKQNNEIIFAFVNHTEESTNSFGNLFYSYAHTNKGSYVYRPTPDTMRLYDDTDNRKAMSIDNSTGNDVINKYSGGQGERDPFNISRLAEMYLISAEAQGRVAGVERLNDLRKTRGLQSIYPANDDDYKNAILLERKKEFLAEGFMYYDLVRTGKAIEVLGLLPHQLLLPIPNTELILNSNFTPNPGY